MLGKLFGKKYTITVLPHPEHCPSGEVVRAKEGRSLAETLVDSGVEISHSCQYQCSCTTCHIHLMEGDAFITPMNAEEQQMLSRAGNRTRWSRLSCQCVFQGGGDIVLEIVE